MSLSRKCNNKAIDNDLLHLNLCNYTVDIETANFEEFGRQQSLPLKSVCFKTSQRANQFPFINVFIILTDRGISGLNCVLTDVLGHTINILHASRSL